MPWRELVLTDANAELLVFTTADLRWQPLVSDDPNGAQIATLWGDPADKEFGAVVQLPKHPPGVYTLIRRRSSDASEA